MSASSDGAVERRVTLPAGAALHARPARALVREAARHGATITLVAGGRTADARSILQVMALALPGGSELVVRAEGDDAAAALDGVVALLQQSH
jgi:phosphocarrier protein